MCWFPTWECLEHKKTSEVAKEQAKKLKDAGIEIFSVGYEVNGNAEQVLRDVASSGATHYFAADAAGVAGAFENIATSVSIANAGTEAKLTDYLGAFVQADGVEGKEITKEI